MAPLTAYIAKLMGAYALLAGAWLWLRREAATALIDRISSDPVFESMIGVLRATVGLAILFGDHGWGGLVEALVSLIGWIALLSGLATMFLPAGILGRIVEWMRLKESLPLYALVSSLLGTALFIGGFSG